MWEIKVMICGRIKIRFEIFMDRRLFTYEDQFKARLVCNEIDIRSVRRKPGTDTIAALVGNAERLTKKASVGNQSKSAK